MPTARRSEVHDGLHYRIRRFCQEYIIDFNGKQAAIRAGYSANGASVTACRLLTNPNVSAAIASLVRTKADELQLTAERVMTEVARIAFSDARELFDDDGKLKLPRDWSDKAAAAVKAYDRKRGKLDLWSKTEALALAARIMKILNPDAVPAHQQGNFVVICPADATPEQFEQLVSQHFALPANQP